MTYYLTYAEYKEMGGTLDETLFNTLSLDAQAYIDWRTFNRLWNETEIPERVKICMYQLIILLEATSQLLTPQVQSAGGINTNAQVASQSNDGVSTTYAVLTADALYEKAKKEIDSCIERYLNGVLNSEGKKLLYRGLYQGE